MSNQMHSVNIDEPQFKQENIYGRALHYFMLTNPANLLLDDDQIDNAKNVIEGYRRGDILPDVKNIVELWRAKYIYEGTFHNGTGEKLPRFVRMSAQIPMHILIIGGMLRFHKSRTGIVFWQTLYQTWSTLVTSLNTPYVENVTVGHAVSAGVAGTGTACLTAMSLNDIFKNKSSLLSRMVPISAVSLGTCVSMPILHFDTIFNGLTLYGADNQPLVLSRKAAFIGIAELILKRLITVIPGLSITPILSKYTHSRSYLLKKYPFLIIPYELAVCTLIFCISTPLGYALFNNRVLLKLSQLGSAETTEILKKQDENENIWFQSL